jgi:hypothetical protein
MIMGKEISILLNRNTSFPLIIFLFLICVEAFSAPYFNQSHEFTQPDGSVVTVILNGDEFLYGGSNAGWLYGCQRSPKQMDLLRRTIGGRLRT